jgi:mono/diheme cytochrome c family protein
MKRAHLFLVITAAWSFALLMPAGGRSADKALGKKLYDEKCQVCHGMKGDGRGPVGLSLTPKPTNFTNPRFWQGNDSKEIADAVRKGRKMMPAFDLKDSEITSIIEYMTGQFNQPAK